MTRIDGTDTVTMRQREGRFWEVQSGRRPGPAMAQFLGGTLQWVDPDDGTIAMAYPPKPELANPGGGINGGILATMLDMTMGGALIATCQADEIPTTIEIKVNYIRPAMLDTLVSEGRVIRKGRSIAFLAAELRTTGGDLIATATATFAIQPGR
jgi:uncharacterized protein (TIGR00369 family)